MQVIKSHLVQFDYLKQFVDEMKKLEEDGFELEGKKKYYTD